MSHWRYGWLLLKASFCVALLHYAYKLYPDEFEEKDAFRRWSLRWAYLASDAQDRREIAQKRTTQ